MKHILSSEQFTREELEEIFDLAEKIKKNPEAYKNELDGKIIAVMFYEPSTRTRLSFETAALKLGAKTITTENAGEFSSAAKGETIEDTVKVIAGYADAMVIRHRSDTSAEEAASVNKMPILNGGAGKGEHPTQALLDLFTIREKFGKIDGTRVAVLGDLLHGRTIHSLLRLLSLYENIEVYGLSKDVFALPQKYIDMLKARNIEYKVCKSFDELPKDLSVIYHTRIQAERFEGDFGKEEFIINKEVLDTFSSNTILMHPLPRVIEIAVDVDDDPRAYYFKQAHNGLYVRMALLLRVLNKA
ncbi:MAG: aspartate carbamoyltransferase [Clostridia bacterium]|jgi:aspartate carbamoyltransferase catalytic subunit|nr:aspartate carbamoyltransferase [Clostridia bacterium]